jgi:hypothetical protein
VPGRRLALLAEDLNDDHGIGIGPIDDASGGARVRDPEFMAPRPEPRQRPRLREAQPVAPLQPPEQDARLDPGSTEKGGVLISPYSQTSGLSAGAMAGMLCQF